MPANLPIDFEEKLRDAKALGNGYPYSIKAEDLMKNFVFAAVDVETEAGSSGLSLEVEQVAGDNGHPGRRIKISTSSGYFGLPEGVTHGDMLYWDATNEEWIILAAPTAGGLRVLSFDPAGNAVPEWINTEECT